MGVKQSDIALNVPKGQRRRIKSNTPSFLPVRRPLL